MTDDAAPLGLVPPAGAPIMPVESVASDLDAMFAECVAGRTSTGRVGLPPEGPAGAGKASRISLTDRTARRLAGAGATLATLLFGVAAGVFVTQLPARSRPAAAEPPQLESIWSVERSVGPAAPPSALLTGPPKAQPAVAAPGRRAPPRSPPPLRAAAKRTAAAPRTASLSHCRGRGDPGWQWCAHSAIMAADRRLRVAYDRAVKAGVDRRELIDKLDRWDELRRRATRDPEHVFQAYGAMAAELSSLGAKRQGRAAGARNPGRRS